MEMWTKSNLPLPGTAVLPAVRLFASLSRWMDAYKLVGLGAWDRRTNADGGCERDDRGPSELPDRRRCS